MRNQNSLNNTNQLSRSNYMDPLFCNITGVKKADDGEFEEALEYFTEAIKLNPSDFISYFNRASIRMHFHDIKGARMDFKIAEELRAGRGI